MRVTTRRPRKRTRRKPGDKKKFSAPNVERTDGPMIGATEGPEPKPRPLPGVCLYQPEFALRAQGLARVGAILQEIADDLGVGIDTLQRWRSKFPEFDRALMVGLEIANNRVEMSLYHQAIGYWVPTEEIKVINEEIVRVPTRTYIPPNAGAAIFWTKCRMGWRENEDWSAKGLPGADVMDLASGETMRQKARRLAFVLYQGGLKKKEDEDADT